MKKGGFTAILISVFLNAAPLIAQISPGELAEPHAHLEGMSNCTQCHILGDKVSNDKCLKCHDDIKSRIDQGKGYHASSDVKSKECVICHNDHHGRKFQIIRFSESTFNHDLTGYKLEGSHIGKECTACHKREFITIPKIKEKKYTYLGLNPSCVSCHEDYHQSTLSTQCADCHGFEKFKPAAHFDHNRSEFPLRGKHISVECSKCHKTTIKNDREFMEFRGIAYNNCSNCHNDVHKGQFGTDCRQCHSEESFHIIAGLNRFDHNKTGYPLEGRHLTVKCNSCHKINMTDPLKHNLCMDCHTDYHYDQFMKDGIKPDCSACHSTTGFAEFSFTVEQHNSSPFKLEGAHLATPCFDCHKKENRWEFRNIGLRCNDCHEDIHRTYIAPKYYPENNCTACHSVNTWVEMNFDHGKTSFALEGAHKKQSCRSCHFINPGNGTFQQRFTGLSTNCTSCHTDRHHNQFIEKGITDCKVCHAYEDWKAVNFDHQRTRFPLDGKHANVACSKCHKEVMEGEVKYVQYTFKDFQCATCHH